MLGFLSLLIIGVVAYAYLNEDMVTSFAMFFNVFLAGLVVFNFWEPLADQLEAQFQGTPLLGYEDALALVLLFCPTLGLLRLVVNSLSPERLDFPTAVQQGGSVFFGALTGYLVSGFLICMVQTLPLHENFAGFQPAFATGFRRWLPADRVWLAVMQRASVVSLSADSDDPNKAFDCCGNFELRYARYRRFTGTRGALPYRGEIPAVRPSSGPPER